MNAVLAPRTFEDCPANVLLFRRVNDGRHPWLDAFFGRFRYLGNGLVLIPVCIGVFIWRRRRLPPLLLALALETLVVQACKQWLVQPRPATLLADVHLQQSLHWGSFPSGDTAMAFVVAVVLLRGERWPVQAGLLLYAALIGYGRIYLGVHFPLDVLAGALVGIMAAGVPALWERRHARRNAQS